MYFSDLEIVSMAT